MNYGLYLSASGILTNMHRMGVISNNLANAQTPAFKESMVAAMQRLPARLEDPSAIADPQLMLERLGGSTLVDDTRLVFKQGTITESGQFTDLALDGDGFFVVGEGPVADPAQLQFTRDGRLTIDRESRLVMVSTGLPVLDELNQPITVGPGSFSIDNRGQVTQHGVDLGKIRVASTQSTADLVPKGDSLMAFAPGSKAELTASDAMVRQGAIESSNVDPVRSLVNLLGASRSIQASTVMMQYQDNIMGQAINTFGRVT